ncbi:MAG: D-glycerate dehydrogenase [Solirubrobacterales bacterium]
MSGNMRKVVVARHLLPAGERLLQGRFELCSGGLDAGRSELLELAPGASAIIADPAVIIDAPVLAAAGESLEVVANFAVGYDNVDLEDCRRAGVLLTNTPGVLTNATAELAMGLTLAAARQIPSAEMTLREELWSGWDPSAYRGIELSEATVGVVGMGRIGYRYGELMSGFGGDLLYSSRSVSEQAEERLAARKVSLEELLCESDVVSLHLAAARENHHLINSEAIAMMKPEAILVNTARGSLVDADALASALVENRLGAAGLDVFENEPGVPASMKNAPRVVLTPHIGSATYRARDAMAELAARNVISVLTGDGPLTPVELT